MTLYFFPIVLSPLLYLSYSLDITSLSPYLLSCQHVHDFYTLKHKLIGSSATHNKTCMRNSYQTWLETPFDFGSLMVIIHWSNSSSSLFPSELQTQTFHIIMWLNWGKMFLCASSLKWWRSEAKKTQIWFRHSNNLVLNCSRDSVSSFLFPFLKCVFRQFQTTI